MYRNSSTSATKRRSANYRWWRAFHLITGFLVALWLLAMSATGVLINHQEGLGLTEMDVSNRHLPAHYTDEFHPETTRLSVVLADLHSGRFFGATGKLISDAVALMVFLSIGTGVYSFFLRTLGKFGSNRLKTDTLLKSEGSRMSDSWLTSL